MPWQSKGFKQDSKGRLCMPSAPKAHAVKLSTPQYPMPVGPESKFVEEPKAGRPLWRNDASGVGASLAGVFGFFVFQCLGQRTCFDIFGAQRDVAFVTTCCGMIYSKRKGHKPIHGWNISAIVILKQNVRHDHRDSTRFFSENFGGWDGCNGCAVTC